MKFDLTFDKDIYNKQMDLLFDIAYKNKIAYYKNAQYLGLILLIIGSFMIFKRPNIFGVGYLFVFFGLSNLSPFLYYYFKIRSAYKKIENLKAYEIEAFYKSQNIQWEFTEKALVINQDNHVKSLDWNEFKIFMVKEDNLILITNVNQPFILGEVEIGSENFQLIKSFVETKIKKE